MNFRKWSLSSVYKDAGFLHMAGEGVTYGTISVNYLFKPKPLLIL